MKYLLVVLLALMSSPVWAAPANDAFATATVVTTGTRSGTNVGATAEAGEPVHAGIPGAKSVWWTWTPTTSGTATISTAGSSFDTVLAVYSGGVLPALTPLAYSDDITTGTMASRVTFGVVANTTYRIAVDGYNGATGGITLSISLGAGTSRSENDDYADRAALAGDYTVGRGSSRTATVEPGENSVFHNVEDDFDYIGWSSNSVWWTWTAPRAGEVAITNAMVINQAFSGDYLYAIVEVFRSDASTIDDLPSVPIGDLSSTFATRSTASLTMTVAAGEVLQIKTSSWDAEYGAQITLTIEMDPEVIINDTFLKRSSLGTSNASLAANNAGASADVGESDHAGSTASRSLWWSWTAPADGYVTIDTLGSLIDTTLGVYTGTVIDSLVEVASNDDASLIPLITTSSVHFAVQKGTVYQIAVDGKAGAEGSIHLGVTFITNSVVITEQPQSASVFTGDPVVFTVYTTGAPAVYDWQRKRAGSKTWSHYSNGVTSPPALEGKQAISTLTINAVTGAMNGDQFRCVIANEANQVTSQSATLTVISLRTYEGSAVSFSIADAFLPLPPATTITYYASNLPPGLTLNKNTGQISGRIAKSGTYTITYWAVTVTGGVKTQTSTRTYVLSARSYPKVISGSFEGLLVKISGVPVGKLELLVAPENGSFSGKLIYREKTISLKGLLTLNSSSAPTAGEATLALANSLTLAITVENDSTMTATLAGSNGPIGDIGGDGVLVKTYTTVAPAPWQGSYTVAFTDAVGGPEGSGYAIGVIDRYGRLQLKGKLSDGTVLTAVTPSDGGALPTFRPYVQLYSNKRGFISGWLPLSVRSAGSNLYHIETSTGMDVYWAKPAISTDKMYKTGFGPVGVNVVMEPWIATRNPYLVGPLGLVTSNSQTIGNFTLSLEQTGGVSNTGANPEKLPVLMRMAPSGAVSVTSSDDNPTNPRKWAVKINPDSGYFSGSFILRNNRKVIFEGVLLQLPVGINDFGRGFFHAPIGSTLSAGDVLFSGPEIP